MGWRLWEQSGLSQRRTPPRTYDVTSQAWTGGTRKRTIRAEHAAIAREGLQSPHTLIRAGFARLWIVILRERSRCNILLKDHSRLRSSVRVRPRIRNRNRRQMS